MKRLFAYSHQENEGMTSALFAMASLMMLLLPTLLFSTSTQKFTAVPLSIASSSEESIERPGAPIKKIHLIAREDGFWLKAWVRTTDVRSSDWEERNWDIRSTEQLHDALQQLKKIDPSAQRITISPLSSSPTEAVVRWMDVVRNTPDGTILFPEVVMEPAQ